MARTLLLAAALLAAGAARAQPVVGLRLAYARALGSAARELPISEVTGAQVPLQADALWRFGAASAGVYLSFAPAQAPSGRCGDGADCSASGLRAGLQGQYALPARGGVAPWLGIGAGHERATRRRERLGSETTFTWSGLEALVQGGVDWPLARGLSAGPFAQLAIGRYGAVDVETDAASASPAVVDRALHAFVLVGVRARLDL